MLYRNGADRERAFGKRRRGLRGERMRGGGRELKVEMDDPNGWIDRLAEKGKEVKKTGERHKEIANGPLDVKMCT